MGVLGGGAGGLLGQTSDTSTQDKISPYKRGLRRRLSVYSLVLGSLSKDDGGGNENGKKV